MNPSKHNKNLMIKFKPLQVCMIVSNAEDSIKKTILSWKNVASRFVIYLNNSTDGTKDILKKLKEQIKIIIHEGPFVNFEYARNKCLELSYSIRYVYTAMIDDSYVFEGNPHLFMEELKQMKPVLFTKIIRNMNGDKIVSKSKRIFLTHLKLRYKGEVHEYLDFPAFYTLESMHINDIFYPNHMKRTLLRKYEDIKYLQENTPRSIFLRANTLYNIYLIENKGLDKVIDTYKQRAEINEDAEEQAQACIFLGHLTQDAKWYIKGALLWPDRKGECYLYAFFITKSHKHIEIAKNADKPKSSRMIYDETHYEQIKDYYYHSLKKEITNEIKCMH